MPRRVVLPEIIPVRQPSDAGLAAAARAASAMQAARRLADWFGDVPVDRATGWEAPAARSRAAAALGLVAPGGPVTPEADQALRWAYEVAYHARYLDTDDDRQLIQRSAELSGHQERDDDDILHDWFHALDALYAHGVEEALPAGAEPGPLDFHGIGGHPLFTLLEHHGTATVEAVSAAIADGATENLAPSRSRSEWNRWTARHGDPVQRYLRLAAGLGAVAVSRSQVTLTPLATWALLKELNARTEQLPPSAELTARQVIVCRLGMTGGDFAAELDGWLAVRDPADAVEALLAAAPGPEDVAYRRTAVQIASGIDGDTEHAWRSALSIAAIRPYVIVELNRRAGRDFQRDPLPGLEPLDCDAVVLASETIMGAYALSIRNSQAIADAVSAAVHPGQEPAALFDAMWRSRHSVALQALKVIGELHPDKKTAKAARAAAWKASSARV
ncbi:MAG TPA: hypothetical protein VMK13_02660 [Streptosporangiaceae bacterium]|nr:hypothetical protein [Streptosporangiaceae bacterium]